MRDSRLRSRHITAYQARSREILGDLFNRLPNKSREISVRAAFTHANSCFRYGMPSRAIASGDSENGLHTDAAFAISTQSGVNDSMMR